MGMELGVSRGDSGHRVGGEMEIQNLSSVTMPGALDVLTRDDGELYIFPVVRSAPHPVDADQCHTVFLGKFGRFEGPPLNKVLATHVLCSGIKAMANRLTE